MALAELFHLALGVMVVVFEIPFTGAETTLPIGVSIYDDAHSATRMSLTAASSEAHAVDRRIWMNPISCVKEDLPLFLRDPGKPKPRVEVCDRCQLASHSNLL